MSLFHDTVLQRFNQSGKAHFAVPVQLASTEEYIDGQFTGNLGEVLIRYCKRNLSCSAQHAACPFAS